MSTVKFTFETVDAQLALRIAQAVMGIPLDGAGASPLPAGPAPTALPAPLPAAMPAPAPMPAASAPSPSSFVMPQPQPLLMPAPSPGPQPQPLMPAPAPMLAPAPQPQPQQAQTGGVTFEHVQQALGAYVSKYSAAQVQQVLQQHFGVGRARDLRPDQWQQAWQILQAA